MDRVRILFSCLPTHGHAYPLIPLALAAEGAGNDIVFATHPDFHPALRAFGLAVAAAGTTLQLAFPEALAAAGLGHVNHPRELASEDMQRTIRMGFSSIIPRSFVRDLGPVIDRVRPDLIVQEMGNPGAGIAAARARIPRLRHGFGIVDGSFAADGASVLEQVGADAGVSLSDALGVPFIDICPSSLQDKDFLTRNERIPLRTTTPVSPTNDMSWKAPFGGNRVRIYLTLGTAMATVEVLRPAIDGLARLEADILVATGPGLDSSVLGDVPDNVRIESWVPQGEVLKNVDLAVHHGGSGTTLGALAAGVPQLLLPQGADQFSNAVAVRDHGAGDQLLPDTLTVDSIEASARVLLTDARFAEAARGIAAEIAEMPAPIEVAHQLAEYV